MPRSKGLCVAGLLGLALLCLSMLSGSLTTAQTGLRAGALLLLLLLADRVLLPLARGVIGPARAHREP